MSNTGEGTPPLAPTPDEPNYKQLMRNPISLIGLALAVVAIANIIFLFILDITTKQPSPYIGIFAYMLMPGVMMLGMALVPVGIAIQRNKLRRKDPSLPVFPRVDFNNPAQRSTVAFFLSFVVIFLVVSAIGSYRAYEFTDSTQFCGKLCHVVMHPEYTAHQASPHARVGCVDCHVGTGAGWYVRSKLSGVRQVFKVALNNFPRPIGSPVENLRPAPETCEQCHWPRKFWGAQLKVINHFGYDEKSTPRQLRLLVKTGGGDPNEGQASGIHWHMNIANIVTFASDIKRQNIPYVKIQDQKGNSTEYYADGANQAEIAKMTTKRMDCVDCHNRPTHIYMPPDRSVDQSLAARRIDPSLPFAKQQSVTILTADYKTTDEAVKAIATKIPEYYTKTYPQIASTKQHEIQSMVAELQRIFTQSIFPEMKVDWRTHPNNVGHFYSQGCFRCHDGNHKSKDGKVITKDCNACHNLLGQDEAGVQLSGNVLNNQFKHPVDLGDMSAVNCSDCHTGGPQ